MFPVYLVIHHRVIYFFHFPENGKTAITFNIKLLKLIVAFACNNPFYSFVTKLGSCGRL